MTRTLLLAAALAFAPAAGAADYVQAPGSPLAFAGSYQEEVFTGRFPAFQTPLSFDPARPAEARLEVDIPLTSASTGNPDYDENLRGPQHDPERDLLPVAKIGVSPYVLVTNPAFPANDIKEFLALVRAKEAETGRRIGIYPELKHPAFLQAQGHDVVALLAGVGAGVWTDVDEACARTIVVKDRIAPNAENVEKYRTIYGQYQSLYPLLKSTFHALG